MQDFTEEEKEELLKNPNVKRITGKTIEFTSSFKIHAVKKYKGGETSKEIFEKAGINLDYFESKYALHAIRRWQKVYLKSGEEGLVNETRGKNSTGRPKKENSDELSYEELKILVEIQRGVIEELKKRKALMEKK